MTLISHTQAATIPSPIKETTCPLFSPKDRNPKLELLHTSPPSLQSISLFLGLWFLAEHPLIIFLKEIPKGASSLSPQTLSVFSLLLDKPSFSLLSSSSHIFCKPPSALHYPSISNPFFTTSPFTSDHSFADVCLRSRKHLLVR